MTGETRTKPRREDLRPGESLCDHCVAKCCRYFALQIDTPERRKEFEVVKAVAKGKREGT